MGIRAALARWLNGSAPPRAEPFDPAKLLARVDQLELSRPAFIAELEALAERCHDILDQAESKRARVAASESRRKQQEQQTDTVEAEQELWKTDRSAAKQLVLRRLGRG